MSAIAVSPLVASLPASFRPSLDRNVTAFDIPTKAAGSTGAEDEARGFEAGVLEHARSTSNTAASDLRTM
jgi:hypothetical protein